MRNRILQLRTGKRAQGEVGGFNHVLMREQAVKRAVWGTRGKPPEHQFLGSGPACWTSGDNLVSERSGTHTKWLKIVKVNMRSN